MRLIASRLVLGIALFVAPVLGAPSTGPSQGPTDSPIGSPSQPLGELDVAAGSSVSDLLRHLQQLAPSFQYVAEPGPWQNAPLPQMRLRAITLPQIVEMLMSVVQDVQVTNIPGGGGGHNSLYVFRTRSRSGPAQTNTQLSAFGIADSVERIGMKNAWAEVPKDQDAPTPDQIAAGRKKALQEVLSLLESAATQADSSSQPTLKLHEETEVLLVKGTAAQLNAVSQSLTALDSSVATNTYNSHYAHLADQYRLAKNDRNNYKFELGELTKSNRLLGDRISQLQTENAALKSRLVAAGVLPAEPQGTSGKKAPDDKH